MGSRLTHARARSIRSPPRSCSEVVGTGAEDCGGHILAAVDGAPNQRGPAVVVDLRCFGCQADDLRIGRSYMVRRVTFFCGGRGLTTICPLARSGTSTSPLSKC